MRSVLLTNDDGIGTAFFRVLVEAFLRHAEVHLAAPQREQSWIGRAVSRHRPVRADPVEWPGCASAWALDGTPTDCVNIALGHLLPQRPEVVVSGINLGFNATVPYILCSGTVAGAVEGSNWGLPAVAFSQLVPERLFDEVKADPARLPASCADTLAASAAHAVRLTRWWATQPARPMRVLNVNFPFPCVPDSPDAWTIPCGLDLGTLFQRGEDGDFRFAYRAGQVRPGRGLSEREALAAGSISLSLLDFNRIGEDPPESMPEASRPVAGG